MIVDGCCGCVVCDGVWSCVRRKVNVKNSYVNSAQVCPSWAATGALEQHISADISLAVTQYWFVSGDNAWLASVGMGVCGECLYACVVM